MTAAARCTPCDTRAACCAGDHYADELEDHLDEFMLEELHVECEDGSPAEVRAPGPAKPLCVAP